MATNLLSDVPTPTRSVASSSGVRTENDNLHSLRDDRKVYVDGELVEDVTTHPAFAGAARSIAKLYDIAAGPANEAVMTFVIPDGERALRAYQIPRTYADLEDRRLAAEIWAESMFGLMDRSPKRPMRGNAPIVS